MDRDLSSTGWASVTRGGRNDGAVTEHNAHPHIDCTGRIALVHNGTIENVDRLRDSLTADGHRFASSVDSEVLSHLIEDQLNLCGDLLLAVRAALTGVDGSWALAVLGQDTGRVVVAAHRSPLLIARTADGNFATSDIAAVADWVDEFRVLEDGEVVDLADTESARSPGSGPAGPTMRCIWRSAERLLRAAQDDADMNGYADYMAKEIDEQPAAAARVLDELGNGVANGALWADTRIRPIRPFAGDRLWHFP